jgi:hypothetical protein
MQKEQGDLALLPPRTGTLMSSLKRSCDRLWTNTQLLRTSELAAFEHATEEMRDPTDQDPGILQSAYAGVRTPCGRRAARSLVPASD